LEELPFYIKANSQEKGEWYIWDFGVGFGLVFLLEWFY
jgi:hypothetical protein